MCIGQTTQALVYVPNAAPDSNGANLMPLGEAGNTTRLQLEAAGTVAQPDCMESNPQAAESVPVIALPLATVARLAVSVAPPVTVKELLVARDV